MASPEAVAWVLNLDAEDELVHGRLHTPGRAMTARIGGLVEALAALVRPGDVVVWPGTSAEAPGLPGRAWCPTRWAQTQLSRAGATCPRAPGMEVLRRVNHRRFAHALGPGLPLARFVTTAGELREALSAGVALGAVSAEACWLLKRPLGYAGRGRRRLPAGTLTAADQAWVDVSLRAGDGLLVEPWVARELDVGLHGYLFEDGRVVFGEVTVQDIDLTGAWRATRLAPPGTLRPEEQAALEAEARRTAQALSAAGYFGAFGLDAFRWRTPSGERRFQPRCELNARYSMGWGLGMQGFRPPAGCP